MGGSGYTHPPCGERVEFPLETTHVPPRPTLGRDDKYSQVTIVSTHATVAEVYAALDRIGEKLHQDEAPEGTLEIYVVDDGRQPVPRPGAQ